MTTYCAMCPDWEIKHPERCSNTTKKAGKTVYFCTARCKEKFLRKQKPSTAKVSPRRKATTRQRRRPEA